MWKLLPLVQRRNAFAFSYCGVNGNKSEKNLQPFFLVIDLPYIKWIKEQAGGFMDDDKLIHLRLFQGLYLLDTVSKYEPMSII